MLDQENVNGPYYTDGSVSIGDLRNAGTGLSGGYHGTSLTIIVLIIFFPALSMYNSIELVILIFSTFNRYKGVYFWSLLIASVGVIPYSLGFLLKFANITDGSSKWLAIVLITIGWYSMVTGQSCVLWSRLHLILEGEKGRRTLHWTKWMIIIDVFLLHVPTTVLTFGSNGDIDTQSFVTAYSIMEKIQMSGFFLQEVILSSIYIVATLRILRTSPRAHTKRLMWQLMSINIIIICLDLLLLGLEAASLYLLETLVKGVIYSIKLKLEFAILGQLVHFVGRPGNSVANEERLQRASVTYFGQNDTKSSRDTLRSSDAGGLGPAFVSNFSELARLRSRNTYESGGRKNSDAVNDTVSIGRRPTRAESVRLPPGMTLEDVNVAMFQHTEDSSLTGIDHTANPDKSEAISPGELTTKSKVGDEAV